MTNQNKWGFPVIKRCDFVPDWLCQYRKTCSGKGVGATHFFIDDFRFESIWNDPQSALKYLHQPIVLSPDFSLYRDWPLALQIWNTYRNRWCGAFWADSGYQVIPTISWSGPESYDFCFAGLEPGGVVAIGTVGLEKKNDAIRSNFHVGFIEMINRLSPKAVLCYGQIPTEVSQLAKIITYPSFWEKKRKMTHGRTRRI